MYKRQQYIFGSYLSGKSITEITTELNAADPSVRWHYIHVRYILSNEKYIGNSLVQKKYTSDTLPFYRKKNCGEISQFYIQNTHQGIISQDVYKRQGFLYEYDGMTQEPVSKTESKSVSQTVTVESGSTKTEENLALLAGSIPYEADGYTGTLTLLPASIHTEAKGYATRSYTVSDTRTYTDLAYNDPSLIPQAVEKNGLTLALTGVTWHGEGGTGANGSLIPASYTATASYSGTGSTRYATGYLTTADYAGTVTRTVTEKILSLIHILERCGVRVLKHSCYPGKHEWSVWRNSIFEFLQQC